MLSQCLSKLTPLFVAFHLGDDAAERATTESSVEGRRTSVVCDTEECEGSLVGVG